ncbi:hypothetical protein J3P95_18135 [Pseudomonas sp. Z5-35]|uniref:hypothetical protein n=1 Tax=unclassified Pseudomonas TaxID=196821 RepID=UPI003DA84A22
MVERLPAPDLESGIRTFKSRAYVDLVGGGTVRIAQDANSHYRARLDSELEPSGPYLERIEASLLWREARQQAAAPNPAAQDAAIISRWRVQSAFAAPNRITIGGHHYWTVVNDNARAHPIAYIKDPAHLSYDFDTLENILLDNPNSQPRGAIRVPPHNQWEIDPGRPFEMPLIASSIKSFPELRPYIHDRFSRRQFELANDGKFADAQGLTTLRQVFHSWRSETRSLHPELSDPLLMLPTLPVISVVPDTVRSLELPHPAMVLGPFARLDFDPNVFPKRKNWSELADDVRLNEFMTERLERNGYTVRPIPWLPTALIFQRPQHDYVYFMTLHRTADSTISIPALNPRGNELALRLQFDDSAADVLQNAHANNKLICLRGGIQRYTNLGTQETRETVFIVRDDT